MANEWYYSHDGERHGPVPVEKIKEMAAAGQLRPDDLVWQSGMETWTAASKVPGLLPPAATPPPIPGGGVAAPTVQAVTDSDALKEASSKKIAAGICGILVGSLGIHKFVLGINTPAIIMLLVTLLTCGAGAIVMHAIGLVEGIIYLTKSDEDFYQTYVVGKKEWF
jgi:TM2 domain-containing membrane protein YozV